MPDKFLPTLSLVINTRNEARTLKSCIKSAQSLSSEIIIMDMESTDETVKIAKSFGAKVFTHPAVGFVEPARQAALNKATSDWILLLDADEKLTPELSKKIKELIKNPELSVIAIPRKNIIFKHWFKGAGYWPNYQIRLFRKKTVRWPTHIHAAPISKKTISYLPAQEKFALQHNTVVNPNTFLAKTDSYTNYEQSFLEFVKIHGFSGTTAISYCNAAFEDSFYVQNAAEDGFPGFVMSKLMETYRFAEVAKYWLRHDSPPIKDWNETVNEMHLERSFRTSRIFKWWVVYQKIKKRLKVW
ncbi:MAG: glycosyltransferase family 2 protein [Microgenomates group bacterium]